MITLLKKETGIMKKIQIPASKITISFKNNKISIKYETNKVSAQISDKTKHIKNKISER